MIAVYLFLFAIAFGIAIISTKLTTVIRLLEIQIEPAIRESEEHD